MIPKRLIDCTFDELINSISEIFSEKLKNNHNHEENLDQLLSRKESAIYLRITPPTLDTWAKAGLIEKVWLPDKVMYRYRKSDLIKVSKSRKQ